MQSILLFSISFYMFLNIYQQKQIGRPCLWIILSKSNILSCFKSGFPNWKCWSSTDWWDSSIYGLSSSSLLPCIQTHTWHRAGSFRIEKCKKIAFINMGCLFNIVLLQFIIKTKVSLAYLIYCFLSSRRNVKVMLHWAH